MVDGSFSLMQLPHIDANHVKKLNRVKIRSHTIFEPSSVLRLLYFG
jgi:hypothetical protein